LEVFDQKLVHFSPNDPCTFASINLALGRNSQREGKTGIFDQKLVYFLANDTLSIFSIFYNFVCFNLQLKFLPEQNLVTAPRHSA